MHTFTRGFAALVAAGGLLQPCLAQTSKPVAYTDPDTGIVFDTWTVEESSTAAGLTFGVALPEDALTTDATEFLGYLSCGLTEGAGWCGLSLGGSMNSNLLLMAYPQDEDVLTSFRFSSGYSMPDVYAGDANLTQISSSINDTAFTLLFRCEGCLAWDHEGTTGNASTSAGRLTLGWAQGQESPEDGACPDDLSISQHEAQSIWSATLDENAASADYETWAELATEVVPGTCDGDGDGGGDEPVGTPVPEGAEYDYVIVGSGPGGMVVADRLSEAGHKVLLIEKGPPSTGLWGGTMKPEWLEGTELTRFDVPGLCNEIWVDSEGIACDDHDQMSGCVLGGGTAVNAGLWWKPNTKDIDENFPEGWSYSDLQASIDKVFERIPGTTHPSTDGKIYLQQGPNVIVNGLQKNGWSFYNLNESPNQKYMTVGHSPYMFSNGERGGPLATYLATAYERDNFDLWLNTTVKRVLRDGSTATGVEVEPTLDGGYEGVVNLTDIGRVVLSAGAFGSPKILFRSGIGPEAQLNIVKESKKDGATMIDEADWINLPVGENLMDHPNTQIRLSHPNVVGYDWIGAYEDPVEEDMNSYLDSRTGPLAQAAPNINPIFFDEVTGPDGVTRSLEYTSSMSEGFGDTGLISITQYVGRGISSRGKLSIDSQLNTVVSTLPWLTDENDVDAVIQGIKRVQQGLRNVTGLTWITPDPDTEVEDYVNSLPLTGRGSNHWLGSCKMGSDDGRDGGTAVVDLDTKVYGTDNIFVVDASIFPGMVATNPSAYITTVAEKAAERILAL
ncbi:cellobiose dehydrogenase [Aspergillus lucknowensis]|uniref:Glucose-methanol-choline oxidoreductase N-terminal domain-containing protein n=1 Tax=Aspergillus lucknowensis TaxID=176173 RepID=A0ABR4LW68_9EURO